MPHSLIQVYVHIVWATKQRQPLLCEALQVAVHRCVAAEALKLGSEVLAVGGVEDHVHVLLRLPSHIDQPKLVQQMKGVSSHVARAMPDGEGFGWQDGYAARSVSPNHIERAQEYVRLQPQHHASGTIHAAWEPIEDEP